MVVPWVHQFLYFINNQIIKNFNFQKTYINFIILKKNSMKFKHLDLNIETMVVTMRRWTNYDQGWQ